MSFFFTQSQILPLIIRDSIYYFNSIGTSRNSNYLNLSMSKTKEVVDYQRDRRPRFPVIRLKNADTLFRKGESNMPLQIFTSL